MNYQDNMNISRVKPSGKACIGGMCITMIF